MPKLLIKTQFHSKELERIVNIGETVDLNKTPKTSLDQSGIKYELVKDKPVEPKKDEENEKAENEEIKNKAESKLKNK